MHSNSFVRTLIFLAFGLFFWLFFPFLKSFFVALLLVIAFTPVHVAFERKIKHYPFLAKRSHWITATAMTLLLITILFLPILFFISYLVSHPAEILQMGKTYYHQGTHLLSLIPTLPQWIEKPVATLAQKLLENQEKIVSTAAMSVGDGVLGLMSALGSIMVIVVFFFFLSLYQRELILSLSPIIPLKRAIRSEFLLDMISTTATGLYTLLGVAIAQGIAFGIFISFFEGYDPWLLGLMIGATSVIPLFGTALIWIPIALNEFFKGNSVNAMIIAFYSWGMLSFFIDNIVRLIILQKLNHLLNQGRKEINEFLLFFAILAGLTTFGFWGFILGPAIVAFTVTLLRVLRRHHSRRP
jgi:predicted PurR-regulated permease PerM